MTDLEMRIQRETTRLNMQSEIHQLRLDLEAARRSLQNELAAHRETRAALKDATNVVDAQAKELVDARSVIEQLQDDVHRLNSQLNQVMRPRGTCR